MPADIVLSSPPSPKISAIPGSPEYRQHTEVQLWVMLKSDAVLQAESMNRTNSGSTGATWTGLLGAG